MNKVINPATATGMANEIKLKDNEAPLLINKPPMNGPSMAPNLPKPMAHPMPVPRISVG